MTTRFSLAELADMLHVPVAHVRQAVEALAAEGKLTAESFVFMDKNWRVAPSDTKVVKGWIEQADRDGVLVADTTVRRIHRRTVVPPETS